jgi:catechol 2,3-dioxygenase-like lactoylglutathione lyase family enzyme
MAQSSPATAAKSRGDLAVSTVPGLRGVEHVAFTVPDIDEAVAFFVDVLGCDFFYELGPASDPDGTWMSDNLDVHPRSVIRRFVLLRCANGANFELFQYESPDQVTRWPRMSDHGGSHVAFYVDDMDTALDHLRSKGVRVLGQGKKNTTGPEAGEDATFAHFLTPSGQMLEFISYPKGREYYETTDRRLWQPSPCGASSVA